MKDIVRVAGTANDSIVDGPGLRMTVFAQGCKHNCPGCHNPQTHSFEGGTELEIGKIIDKMKKNPLLDGLTISGGEPFEQAEGFGNLAVKAAEEGYNVITYTGYTFEELVKGIEGGRKDWSILLKSSDILVDGKFVKEKRNIGLRFRGSENQRLIDVKKSLEIKKAVNAEI